MKILNFNQEQGSWQQRFSLKRFKRSDDDLKLPENFEIGQAIGGGDCFFDSVAKGLKQIKPNMDFTVKSLRMVCKRFAQSQLENDKSWLKESLKNEPEPINVYVSRIAFTASDINQGSGAMSRLGLTSPIWGRGEIEGRIICKEYGVKLHVIEKHNVAGKEIWTNQIVDESGSRSMDTIDYNEVNTIHMVNKGHLHFEPILNTVQQENQHSHFDSNQSKSDQKLEFNSGSSEHSEQAHKFKKNKSNRGGTDYELVLSMLVLKRATENQYEFELATERTEDEKFDDLFFKYGTTEKKIYLLQAKYTDDTVKKIAYDDLKTQSDTKFSLAKYFNSYRKIKEKGEFKKDLENLNFIICTTIHFDSDGLKKIKNSKSIEVIEVEENDGIFKKDNKELGKRYKLKVNTNEEKQDVFKDTYSSLREMTDKLAECILEDKNINIEQLPILKRYHIALGKEIINTKKAQFYQNFLFLNDSEKLSEKAKEFRKIFYELTREFLKEKQDSLEKLHAKDRGKAEKILADFREIIDKGLNDETAKDAFWKKLEGKKLKLVGSFGKFEIKDNEKFIEEFTNIIKTFQGKIVEVNKNTNFGKNINKLGGYVLTIKGDVIKFNEEFLKNKRLPDSFEEFRKQLKEKLGEKDFAKLDQSELKFNFKNEDNTKFFKEKIYWDLDDDYLESEVINSEIDEFLKKLVFVVTPKVDELKEAIKNEMEKEFGQMNGDNIYNTLNTKIVDWINYRDKEGNGYYLSHEDNVYDKAKNLFLGPVWFDVRDPIELFTGREKELDELHRTLQRNQGKNKMTVISQVTSVSGLGGIGKTELARQYIHEHSKDYDNNIIWVNAESEGALIESFHRLAQNKLRISTKNVDGKEKDIKPILEEVYKFFAKRKSLFVFDNAEKNERFNQFLPLHALSSSDNKPYILITSREKEWGREIEVIELKELKLEDAIELVKKGLKIAKEDREQNQEIKDLVVKLQCFPLAIQQAIAYIEDQGVVEEFGIDDYIKEYEKKAEDLLGSEVFRGIDNDYAKTTFTTWQITIDKIKGDKQYGELALKILDVTAYFAPENINREMFLDLADNNKEQLKSAIRLLVRYSMINGEQKQSILSIHRLVQEVTRLELKGQNREEEVLEKSFNLLKVSFPYGSDKLEDYSRKRQLLPHLEAFLSHIDNWSAKKPEEDKEKIEKDYLEDLLIWMAHGYMALGDPKKQKELLERALAILEKHYGPDHFEVARTLVNLGNAYGALGDHKKQKELLERALAILEKHYGPDHFEVARTLVNLGNAYGALGDHKKQKELLERALPILERHYGANHQYTLIAKRNRERAKKEINRCNIQHYEKQQKAFLDLSKFISYNTPHAEIESVKQGLYVPAFEERNLKINGKCAAITRMFSQGLDLEGEASVYYGKQHKLFVKNLETSAELYERLAQGKQISLREEREIFDLSKLFDGFEQQLDLPTSSLPSSLSHVKSYKTFDDLSRYVGDLTGNFALHLVTSNHVVAIYRTGDTYSYFDTNVALVSGLKSVHQLMKVLEKAVAFAGYELAEDGFLVEHFDVAKANNALTTKQKEVLTKPIQTERQLLSLQDQKLGHIDLNGKQVSRVTLYDLGTKLHLEGSSPILINADMNLSSENLLAYLNTGKVSITAREYLENLRNRAIENAVEKTQELTQATKVIPFAGSHNEIKHAQQIQELLSSDVGRKLKSYELGKLLKSPIEESIKALSYYLEVANSKHWPNRLTNAAGRIQLIRGIHGAAVSCDRDRGNTKDCLLNTGEISLSLVSQLIEDGVVKNVPKLIKSLKTVKFGTHILRGGAAIISSPFDVYDLIDSAIDLHNCERGSNECKDAIAGVTFASTSLASGVVLTAIGAPGIGTAVGLVIMVAQGAYSGGRAIEEFQPYRLTFDENFRLFWHAFALQPVPKDLEYIKARKDIVSQIAKQIWEQLQNRSEVAHVTGLGDVTFKEERECKPVQEGLDRYQSCTHRKVRVPTLFPSNATILMDLSSIKGNDYQRFLSRVLPDSPSQDAVMLCLPAFSGKDYERDYTLSNGYPKYESSSTVTSYCENAIMVGDKQRMNQVINKKVVFDLNLVNQGVVVGSDKWQNDFIIYKGKTKVLGGENTRNTFILTDDFTGTIFGGKNSTNMLDVSNLSNSNYSLYIDNLSSFDRTSYVKDYINNKKQGEEQSHFYGVNNIVISANTTVAGNGNSYTFYIKPTPGYSKVNVSKGSIVFPETALLLDCHSFTYSPESNVLSMKFNNFTLDIGNYFNREGKSCNFELIDKHGSSIEPLVDLAQSNSQEVKLFNLRAETDLTYNNVTKWYEDIAEANERYQVYGTVKVKYPIAQEKYGSYPNMIFGTSGSDIIPLAKETWYAEGRKGSDSYNVISDCNSSITTEINNYAEDGVFDLLYMPVNSIQVSRDNNNLHLHAADSTHSVKVKDYFVNSSYQHLTVIDENKDVFVPKENNQQSVQLVPFYHATKDQYMFSLSAEKIRNNSEIIVDAKLDNMKFYRDGSNLVLIDDKPIMVKLEGFYDKDKSLQNLTINFWHDHHKDKLNSQQLFELAKLAINYQDEIRNTYYDSVKEYIVPASNATIHHNQELTNGTLATVGPSSKRVGVLVLQDPSGIEVSVNNEDLVFFVGQNNATFTIKNWNDTDHRVSTLRFNQAKEIRGLDKFDLSQVSEIQSLVSKAALNGVANQQLEKLDSNVANGIKYLLAVRGIENGISTHKCLGFDSAEEEQLFISAYHYSSEKLSQVLHHNQVAEALVWLIVKRCADLLLEDHSVDRRSLLDELNKCFDAVTNKRIVNRIVRKLEEENVKTIVPKVEAFIEHHKAVLENKIVNSLRGNTTNIIEDTEEDNHRRKRRDESEVQSYENEGFFYGQNNANSSLKGQQVTSGGNKLSSWISDLFGWAKSSITGFLAPSTEQVSGNIVQPEISNAFVDGFLMLSDVGVRKLTGNKYRQPKHESLLSPKELIEKRMDYTAIDAINNLGNIYNDQSATKVKICEPINYLRGMSLKKSNVKEILYSSPQPSLKEIAIEPVNKSKVIGG